jgi:hypothetical protein
MRTNTIIRASLSLFALAAALIAPSLASAEYTPEFGEYTTLPVRYPSDLARQYGEWNESTNYFDKSDWIGRDNFGAGYRTWGNTGAYKNSERAVTYAGAGLTSDINVFGYNIDVLDAYASAYTQSKPAQAQASVSVYMLGHQLYSNSGSGRNYWEKAQPLFSVSYSKTFYIGGLPIEVGASATGRVWASLGGEVQPLWMRAGFNAGAGVYAQAYGKAGSRYVLGCWAKANMTLLEATGYFTAVQSWEFAREGSGCRTRLWRGADGGLNVKALSGYVRGQVQALTFTETRDLFSWSGFNWSQDLVPGGVTATVGSESVPCPQVGG